MTNINTAVGINKASNKKNINYILVTFHFWPCKTFYKILTARSVILDKRTNFYLKIRYRVDFQNGVVSMQTKDGICKNIVQSASKNVDNFFPNNLVFCHQQV